MLRISKKKLFSLFLLLLLLSHIVFVNFYRANPTAEYVYDNSESVIAIKFKNQVYESMSDDPPKPYDFIYDEFSVEFRSHLVLHNELSDFLFMWDRIHFYSEDYDNDKNFIRCSMWGGTSDDFYVKEGFVYPTIYENQVDEIWMTMRKNNHIIKNKETVDKIVECAKSKGKIELDEEIVEYIKKYSHDNHCIYLKYKGYPLVEEFHIEETEDGRYIIDQYTPEEYDTIYWEEEAHQ